MQTFSVILIQLLQGYNMKMSTLHKRLEEAGAGISYPSLAAYKNFDSVPTFDRARRILDALGYEISDEALTEVLEYSRKELKLMREDDSSVMSQGVRLSPKAFSSEINAYELKELIDQRISDVFSGNGNFNSYVTKLIKDDLIESNILTRGEDN